MKAPDAAVAATAPSVAARPVRVRPFAGPVLCLPGEAPRPGRPGVAAVTPRLTRNVLMLCGVILADLALKALVVALWEPDARAALVPGVLAVGHVPTGSPVPGLLAEAEGWRRSALVGFGALVLLWLVDVLRRGQGAARWAPGSLYLLAAGVVSNTLDLLVMGQVTRYLVLGGGALALNLADLAIAGGLAWLAAAAVRYRGVPERSLLPLAQAPFFDVPLERFPRGVDNVRVDVRLSPRFMQELRRAVAGLVASEMARGGAGSRLAAAEARERFEELRAAYAAMLEAATHRARREGGRVERVQLLQLGVLKAVQEAVRHEIDGVLQELRGTLREAGGRPGQGLELYERLVTLAKRRPRLQYAVARRVWTQLMQVEAGPAAELRRSLLGSPWALPREVLDNPLLHATDPTTPDLLMRHYVLLGHRSEDRQTYVCVEREVEALFARAGGLGRARPGLPPRVRRLHWYAWEEAVEPEVLRRRVRRDLDHAVPGTEVPENVDVLLDAERTWERMEAARRRGDLEEWGRLRLQRRFQELELRRLEDAFRDHGVLGRIIASYEVVPLYREHYRGLSPLLLLQYLGGGPGAARALEKIRAALGPGVRAEALAPLREAARRVRRCPARRRRALIRRYLKDFLAYRRDLRAYFLTRALLEQIRLVEGTEELRLARANRTLQDFPDAGERQEAEAVAGHVILKADLRGSTRITRELVRRGLNPATHFDLHFFGPVNELLVTFGAEKIFVEGDAVIAGFMEPAGGALPRMAVARACGLAKAIVDLVRAHNAGCRRHGLPELEVGIGIAWWSEPPAYLYDGDRPITISPAIGQADRLSSCARFLRAGRHPPPGIRAQTFRVPPGHPLAGEKGERELHYNVDGALLHRDAFPRLAEEIRLGRVEVDVPGFGMAGFYAGRYLDARGSTRRLVVREGWVTGIEGAGGEGLRYYEVVVDEALATRVWRALEAEQARAGTRAP